MADTPIVLDGGTGFLKVGYAAQNFPEHQYPSIVGRPILRSEERNGDIVVKDIMCGDEAAAARSMLQITYPVLKKLPPSLFTPTMESLTALVADAYLARWTMAS
jgi:actin-related protein